MSAQYAIPKLWTKVAELGYPRSHRGVIRLRNKDRNFVPPMSSEISNRLIETKFNPDYPSLVSENIAWDLFSILNHHLVQDEKAQLYDGDIIRFSHCVRGLSNLLGEQNSEHGTRISNLSESSSLPEEIVRSVCLGKRYPLEICERVVKASGIHCEIEIPRARRASPESDSRILSMVFEEFE